MKRYIVVVFNGTREQIHKSILASSKDAAIAMVKDKWYTGKQHKLWNAEAFPMSFQEVSLITQLLQKQLEAQLELIYLHIYEFVKHFFTEEEAEMADNDEISYYIAFTHVHIYIQKHWVTDGDTQVQEVNIDYEDYNKWAKQHDEN